MLREAHAVDADDGLRLRVFVGGRFERGARQPRLRLRCRAQFAARTASAKSSKPCVCSAMNVGVQHARLPSCCASSSASISALQMPMIAAMSPPDLDLVILRADLRVVVRQHLAGDCGLAKRSSPRSRSGLNVMIGHAALARFLQRGAACAGCSCRRSGRRRRCSRSCAKSSSVTVPTGTPMRFRQRHRRALVAHVRAVGQVVAAVHAREKLVHVRRLRATRGPRRRTRRASDRSRAARGRFRRTPAPRRSGT